MQRPVTIFTTCKTFKGEAALVQNNALQTWQALGIPIILCGTEEGVAEAAVDIGATHIPDIEYSDSGMPYLRSIFSRAEETANTPYLAYVNSDIILTADLLDTIQKVLKNRNPKDPLLLTFRRRNIPISQSFRELEGGWQAYISRQDKAFGSWDQSNAIDLFLFNKGLFDTIIPLVIGHMQWDNWLMWKAADRGADIVDGSLEAALFHPIHGYASDGTGLLLRSQGEQAVKNRELASGNSLTLSAARTHMLRDGKIVPTCKKEGLEIEAKCQPNIMNELWAGVEYLHQSLAQRSTQEILDCCRTILWRHERFFPRLEEAGLDHDAVTNAINTAKKLQQNMAMQKAADILQDLVLPPLLARLRQLETSRPIVIWGCGQLGKRLHTALERHGIPVNGFIDKDPRKTGQTVNGTPVIGTQPDQLDINGHPFFLIGSMYVQEIAAELENAGFKRYEDYSA